MTQPPPGYGPPASGPEHGGSQYGQPQYGVPGQPQYGVPGQPQYGQPQYGVPGQPQYGAPGQPPFGMWVPQAPKPGCVPLRPLGVGDILDGSFTMIRRNPKVTLGLSALVAVLQLVLVAASQILTYASLGNVNVGSSDNPSGNTNLGPLLGSELLQVISIVAELFLGAILTGMLTIAVTQDVLGIRMTIGEVWQRARPRLWALIGIALLMGLLTILGVIACIVPGIYLWGAWAVAVPAMMVENGKVRASMKRSRELVRGTWWRVWGIRALGFLVSSVIGGFLGGPFLIAAALTGGDIFTPANNSNGGIPILGILLISLGSAVSAAFTAPIRAGIDALLYVDLRMRKEGLDIALQQAARARTVAGPPTAQSAF